MSACQSCGTALAADTRFCQSCGSPTELRSVASVSAIETPAGVAVVPSPGEAGSKTMDTNLVGALTYLAGFITGIIFLVRIHISPTPLFASTLSSPSSSMSHGSRSGSFG